jgi:GT2 family glycosyltransferase
MNTTTDLSVIIVNYRGWERLSQCLDSLYHIADDRFTFEVIVVDNYSNDWLVPKFQNLYPYFTFVVNSDNLGFANGCNLGASISRGSTLLFLNPDTIVNAEAIFQMLTEIRQRKSYSIVSCRQVKANGSAERPYGNFLSIFTLTGWLRAFNKLFGGSKLKPLVQNDNYIYPDWVSGSVFMMGKPSFKSLGGWDEDFWMYFEDVDLCYRARIKGGEVVKLKNAIVEHNHGGASRINPKVTALTKAEVNISRHVYISKHQTGIVAVYMHTFLILNNLLFGLLPAVAGAVFIYSKDLNTRCMAYFQLVSYYYNVFSSGRWLSKRSVNYPAPEKYSSILTN